MGRESATAASIVAWVGFAAGAGATISWFLVPWLSRRSPHSDPEAWVWLSAFLGVASLACWGLWAAVGSRQARRRSRRTIGVGVLLAAFGLLGFALWAAAAASTSN